MMAEVLSGIMAGALLCALFLGGLALTLRRLSHSGHPASLILASFVTRAVVVTAAFVLLAIVSSTAFVAAFVSFVLLRTILVWGSARRVPAVPGE
jgi:F1F0 ATPase subunit 2